MSETSLTAGSRVSGWWQDWFQVPRRADMAPALSNLAGTGASQEGPGLKELGTTDHI